MEPLLDRLRTRPHLTGPQRLFVLNRARTFSAAMINTIQLQQQFGATIAGEPSASSPNFICEPTTFPLPFSAIEVRISTLIFHLIPGFEGDSL